MDGSEDQSRDVQRSRTRRFAAITAPLMGAIDEGIARERPCPGACRIGEAKGVRATCVVARSLPLAYEKNRPGREQSLRRWPLRIYRVVQMREDHANRRRAKEKLPANAGGFVLMRRGINDSGDRNRPNCAGDRANRGGRNSASRSSGGSDRRSWRAGSGAPARSTRGRSSRCRVATGSAVVIAAVSHCSRGRSHCSRGRNSRDRSGWIRQMLCSSR